MPMSNKTSGVICAPERWGLPPEAIASLGKRLWDFWDRYRDCFKTKTHESAGHAWTYLRGLLGMKNERNFANIARRVTGLEEDGQNLQQFVSDSPWIALRVWCGQPGGRGHAGGDIPWRFSGNADGLGQAGVDPSRHYRDHPARSDRHCDRDLSVVEAARRGS